MSKILIAYFSASGVTAQAAQAMAAAVGADLFEIVPSQRYTDADLNWQDKKSRSSLEMNDPACRPEISSQVENMAQYDKILLGFPIWWYVEPRIVDTFLESYDFSGKTLIPFATSGGSGMEKAQKHLAEICPSAYWEKGRRVSGAGAADFARSVL